MPRQGKAEATFFLPTNVQNLRLKVQSPVSYRCNINELTMKVLVLHLQAPHQAWRINTTEAKRLLEETMGSYQTVAEVECADLEVAFELTQNIFGPWQRNEGVSAAPGPQRSSSVGDVFVDCDTQERFLVASVGFTKF